MMNLELQIAHGLIGLRHSASRLEPWVSERPKLPGITMEAGVIQVGNGPVFIGDYRDLKSFTLFDEPTRATGSGELITRFNSWSWKGLISA